MSEKKMALIPMAEYKRLVRRDTEFDQLEACGVDNWNGWGQYDDITGEDGEQEISDAVKECEESFFEEKMPPPVTTSGISTSGMWLEPVDSKDMSDPFEEQD